ncbi:hypothetical protein C8R43DRAFT_1121730 [Mycena crocata]|nr:hypothetical protein C8R43DRAFT_1121730 [Mycena crocata]
MPPSGWTTDEEFAYLQTKIPEYVRAKANGTFWKFWPALFEEWFRMFPEEKRLGFETVTDEGDAVNLSPEQEEAVGRGLLQKRNQLETWFRWHSQKVNKVAASQNKREDSLANAMFEKKAPRRRAHRPSELFQKRNKAAIDEALRAKGFFEINEAHMAATVVDWAEEDDETQKARIKTAQAARMRMRTCVVDELFSQASEEELRCIEELIEEETKELALRGNGKKGRNAKDAEEAEDQAREPTPEDYQRAIDESPEVVARVHKVLAKKTGWFGITIYGGPNPRYGGGLSMKTVCFGRTQTGNDFEVAHGSFDESISKHFQVFLKRSFPTDVRRARALQEPESQDTPDLPSLESLFRLPDETVPPAPEPLPKPKRIRKKKPKASKPSPTTSASAVASVAAPQLSALAAPVLAAAAQLSSPAASVAASAPTTDESGLMTPPRLREGSVDPFFDGVDGGPDANSPSGEDWSTRWPEGMGPPSSPSTAEAAANAERGGTHGATYMQAASPPSPPIDPVLLDNRSRPNWPRPAWRGAGIPGSPTPKGTVRGVHFAAPTLTSTPSRMPPRLNGLINRFHHIMDPPSASSSPSLSNVLAVDGAIARANLANVDVPNALSQINTPPALVSPNSPARISRISSTAAGASKTVESPDNGSSGSEHAAVTPSSSEPPPFKIRSRPMARDPGLAKAKTTAPAQEKKKATTGRGGGRKKVVARDASKKEAAAKAAAEAPTERVRKGKGTTVTAGDGDGALDNLTNLDDGGGTSAAPTIAAPPPAPILTFTMTNNNAVYARQARRLEVEKKAQEVAARKERARLHNPDGPSDLVILPPPGRAQRARRPVRNFDGSQANVPKKLSRADQQAKRNEVTENALLARTGGKRGAEDEVPATSRATKKARR